MRLTTKLSNGIINRMYYIVRQNKPTTEELTDLAKATVRERLTTEELRTLDSLGKLSSWLPTVRQARIGVDEKDRTFYTINPIVAPASILAISETGYSAYYLDIPLPVDHELVPRLSIGFSHADWSARLSVCTTVEQAVELWPEIKPAVDEILGL